MPDKEFLCPECGGSLSADESLQGREAPCPHCQKTITIQFPDSIIDVGSSVEKGEEPEKVAPQPALELECPSCGTTSPKNARFCPNCGSPIPTKEQTNISLKRFCTGCGAPLSQDAIICVSCGLNQVTGKSVADTSSHRSHESSETTAAGSVEKDHTLGRAIAFYVPRIGLAVLLLSMFITIIDESSCSKRDRRASSAVEQFPTAEQLKKVRPAVEEMRRLGYTWGARDWCYWFRYAQEYGDEAVLYDEIRAVGVYSQLGRSVLLPSRNTDPAEARKQIASALNMARIDEAPIRLLYGYHQKIIDDMRSNGW